MQLLEILRLRGIDISRRIKMIRHQPPQFDVYQLVRDGVFEVYQSYQSKTVMECELVVSFLAGQRSRAVFWGVYQVLGRRSAMDEPPPAGLEHLGPMRGEGYHYTLEELPEFRDLQLRMVVDWGRSALAWHQWLTDREVIEILPHGYVREFPGYLDFVLRYDELRDIISNPEANRTWHTMLAEVAGVYLIVDQRTGRQYVGSAYGSGGILARWSDYAKIGHGGNKQLVDLMAEDPQCAAHFTFSILRTLPRTLTRNEVIKFEVLYKNKLGSRAFGLNAN